MILAPQARRRFGWPIAMALLVASVGGLAGCADGGKPAADATAERADDPTGETTAASVVLDGSHTLDGRVLTVRLPYRRDGQLVWVADDANEAPFEFRGLDVEPNGGGPAIDVSVFTYEASGPGSARLRFGLVPIGKTISGPPGSPYVAEPQQVYVVSEEVP